MKTYLVEIPIAGLLSFGIEAENENEAVNKVWEIGWRAKVFPDNKDDDVELHELEMYESLVSGNVLHVPYNEIIVQELK